MLTHAKEERPLALPEPPAQDIIPVNPKVGDNVEQTPEADNNANPRAYNELMDAYSLHQFIIRKGKVIESTPEFASFKRLFTTRWGDIVLVIHALEKLLGEYTVPLAYVDGKKMSAIALDPFKKWDTNDLLHCLVNQDNVLSHMKLTGKNFIGSNARELAATYIVKTIKMIKQRRLYKGEKKKIDSANRIQRASKHYLAMKLFKDKVQQKHKEELVQLITLW